ncbi:hypothetical protein LDO31_02420 [Luteimonas sp. XNQY3]|nr:hypothetical protein [Luteimonas sp. XNQY3]MCD9005103.1 hypothetical protein [Luteimonas sp. XNQY3]
MIKRLASVLLVGLLAACSAPAERTGTVVPVGGPDKASVTNEAECIAVGGQWTRLGRAPVEQCLRQTTDAGKACTDSEQCEGQCLAPEGSVDGARVGGSCSVDTNPFGCQQRLRGGVASTICVD